MAQIERYRLDDVHGIGAFATVWRAFDVELDLPVALKILAENWANHADVRERFLAEARLLRRIVDSRVVRVHDVGVHEERPYFVMDFVPNGTLADRIGPDVPASRALRLAAESARAVQVLHDAGVLHRDVKPTNLLVRVDGDTEHVLVSDLGSAKRLAESSGYTVTTGTPAYMAPEQARGRSIDARADVYSLGVMTYELLSGHPPYEGSDLTAAIERPPGVRPEPLAPRRGLPRSLDRLLAGALATQPEARPASPAAFADALDDIAAGAKVRGLRPLHREVATSTVLLLALVAFLVAAVCTWYLLP